ncbi:hypothetical protein ACIBHX_23755 [Nonomuraea sp. NPDC050536]|uniref:hypothetical protein n=1 Tax=Nonomuraea sp. NPDC050536 TaxID=3364366 RepID=UPI0037C6B1F0
MTRHQEDRVSREIQAVGGWPEWGDLWETTWWRISEQVKTPLRTGEQIGEVVMDEVYERLHRLVEDAAIQPQVDDQRRAVRAGTRRNDRDIVGTLR